MPFMHKNQPAKIDRTNKRDDDFIHENIVRTLKYLAAVKGKNWIKILPCNFWEPSFNKASLESSLTTYAIKELGLTWYEVEHWLDEISHKDAWTFYLETESSLNVDERRRYYKGGPHQGILCIRNIINYKPKQP